MICTHARDPEITTDIQRFLLAPRLKANRVFSFLPLPQFLSENCCMIARQLL